MTADTLFLIAAPLVVAIMVAIIYIAKGGGGDA